MKDENGSPVFDVLQAQAACAACVEQLEDPSKCPHVQLERPSWCVCVPWPSCQSLCFSPRPPPLPLCCARPVDSLVSIAQEVERKTAGRKGHVRGQPTDDDERVTRHRYGDVWRSFSAQVSSPSCIPFSILVLISPCCAHTRIPLFTSACRCIKSIRSRSDPPRTLRERRFSAAPRCSGYAWRPGPRATLIEML